MAEAQAATPARAATPLRLKLRGMVTEVTKRNGANGDTFTTLVRAPAPDSYSSPGTYEVRSRSRVGTKGQEIEVLCDVRGYSRSYKRKDGETVKTAEHVLQAVDGE